MKYNHNIPEDEFILIEGYLTNSLGAEERVAFEKKLLQNSDLQQKINELKLLLLGIQETELKTRLSEFHQGLAITNSSLSIKVSKNLNFPRMAIAASVLVLLSMAIWGIWFRQPLHQKLFSRYYSPDPGLATVMSQSDSYDFEKAMVEYKNEEYQKAVEAWEVLLAKKSGNDTLIYFIGSAQMAMEQYEKAGKNFEQVAGLSSSAFQRDACWYMGMYYLRENQKRKAIEYLTQSGYPEATALINEINKP